MACECLRDVCRVVLVVVFAERDAQRAAHVVTCIGRTGVGELRDQRAVVLAGEFGERDERRRAAHRLGREDAGASIGGATLVVPVDDHDAPAVLRGS